VKKKRYSGDTGERSFNV